MSLRSHGAMFSVLALVAGCGQAPESVASTPIHSRMPAVSVPAPEVRTPVQPVAPVAPQTFQLEGERPFPEAFGVGINTTVNAIFERAVDPGTVDAQSLMLEYGTSVVPCEISVSGTAATLTPIHDLLPNATYKVTARASIRDVHGLALAADQVWTFTTTDHATPPVIVANFPANAEAAAAIGTPVAATFTARLDGASINTSSFVVEDANGPLAGAVSYANGIATFIPSMPLMPGVRYLARVTTAARTEAGQPLETPYEWSFVTAAQQD